jgi:hypothetical protein
MDGKGDIIDQGNATAELFNRAAISQRKPEGPQATGFCFNCDAHVAPKQRWCDVGCRDDWEKQQRATQMSPREPDPIV